MARLNSSGGPFKTTPTPRCRNQKGRSLMMHDRTHKLNGKSPGVYSICTENWLDPFYAFLSLQVVFAVYLSGGLLHEAVVIVLVTGQSGKSPIGASTYVIRSFLSFSFLRPPKAILVPGMYFLGFSRYSNYVRIWLDLDSTGENEAISEVLTRVVSFQVTPFALLASV